MFFFLVGAGWGVGGGGASVTSSSLPCRTKSFKEWDLLGGGANSLL